MRKFLLLLAILIPAAIPAIAAADMTNLEIRVVNDEGKGIDRASITVKFVQGRSAVKLGAKIRKEWDLHTNQEGSVKIPAIPQGKILIQINAKNYQTFGQVFDVLEEQKTIEIKLKPPQPQYSAHDKDGKD